MDPKFHCAIIYNPKPNYLFYLVEPYASDPNSKFLKAAEFCWVQTCFLGLNPVTGVEMHLTATIPSFFINRLEQNHQKKLQTQNATEPKQQGKNQQIQKDYEPNQHENQQIQNATETKQQEKQIEKQKPEIQKEEKDETKKDLTMEISLE